MERKIVMNDAREENHCNYYSYVMAVAKRAREIVDNHEDSDKYHTIKPVKLAEDEFEEGKYHVVND